MNNFFSGRIFVFLGLILLLSGCVYLRLLTVKRQLQDFDAHFAIGGRSEMVIEFKDPVLTKKDARFLIGADPSSETSGPEVLQHFDFILQAGTGSVPRDNIPLGRLTLDLAFRQNKLVKIIVPETFMLLFPRHVLAETLKQAKAAEVFETRKLAQGTIRLPPTVEAELPSLSKTLFLLGEPDQRVTEGDLNTLFYSYRIATENRPVPILVRLSFRSDGLLHRVYVKWDQSAVRAIFIRTESPATLP